MLEDVLDSLAELCSANALQIVTAESCTGGLVAKLITDRAGSSQWFERGFVTYSNLAKEQLLDVGTDVLQQWGAVSEPVAAAMAQGALKHSPAQLALAITGIAGPDGGTDAKPVGTVCFGWAYIDGNSGTMIHQTSTQHFSGDRGAVREQSAIFALQQLVHLITGALS